MKCADANADADADAWSWLSAVHIAQRSLLAVLVPALQYLMVQYSVL